MAQMAHSQFADTGMASELIDAIHGRQLLRTTPALPSFLSLDETEPEKGLLSSTFRSFAVRGSAAKHLFNSSR
jgi:hypothetical protein